MHIKKTLTLKRYKKREKTELQKRKSTLFNEKLELIKISKNTQKKYTQQHYVLTHKGEKQWSKTTQHGLSVKGKCVHMHTRIHTPTPTHTHPHAHTHKNKTKKTVFSTLHSIYNKHKFRIILQCFLS